MGDVYYPEPQVFKMGNWNIRVFRPILTDEERARRMKEIEEAAAELLTEIEKIKAKKAKDELIAEV